MAKNRRNKGRRGEETEEPIKQKQNGIRETSGGLISPPPCPHQESETGWRIKKVRRKRRKEKR